MDNPIRILLLEDVEADADIIQNELKRANFAFTLKRVDLKEAFLKELEAFSPHLVLSDYVLEQFDGLSALALVREKAPYLPFIFVSWTIHEDSVIETMKKGATDYVFKDHLSRLSLSIFRALHEAEQRLELEKTQERAIEQERLGALGQMASGIAHDFSNALMPVVGYSELLINHPENLKDPKKLDHFLKMINTAARDAMNIVNRLRAFYRKKENAEKLAPVRLNQIVEQVVQLTQPKWKGQALSNGIMIKVEQDLRDDPVVLANDSALREALANLVFNSVDAMPQGGVITLSTRADGKFVFLEARDTGTGMSEEVRKHCFEPFYSTKGKGGTGMGLPMVYGVVRRHEGSIEVKSVSGKGTQFIIRLPKGDPVPEKSGPVEGTNGVPFKAVRKLRVLAVDDEPMVLEVLREYLTTDGHALETAGDPTEGLKKFDPKKFDLLVTDWAMPGMNGDELVAKIKKISPRTPVIMLSGFGELIESTHGRKPLGVDILMSKPLTLQAMREALSKILA